MVDLNSTFPGELEESHKIKFTCPICNLSKSVLISKNQLKSKGSLTTIAIPKNFMCPHSFSAFIDRNGVVRGYQKNDLEIFSLTEKEGDSEVEKDEKFLKLKILLGDEIFLKSFKAALNNFPICCITDNQFIEENFHYFFDEIFEKYTPSIFVTSLENYNKNLRKDLILLDNVFLFSTRLCSISSQPFAEGFNESDFELETYLLDLNNLNHLKDSAIIEYLSTKTLKLFSTIENIKDDINKGDIKSKNEIQKILKKVTGKKFSKDVLNAILINRYGLDITKKFLNGFFGTL